jgi:hypothetical protein
VRHAAKQNKGSEQKEDSAKREILSLADEVDKNSGDDEVRREDRQVGDDMQPAVTVRPVPALPLGWKVRCVKEF